MICLETFGPVIHVEVILKRTINLNIVVEQVQTFKVMMHPNGSGFFQRDNTV